MSADSAKRRSSRRRVATVLVAFALVTVPLAGGVVAGGADGDSGSSFVAVQDGECTPITSFADDKSVREFYDYRIPQANNTYSNTTGTSYSSEGTRDLQRANTSIVFLYTDTTTDTVSLVFVHGNEGNENSTGGSATFNITGLPEDGRWAVKDDEYNGSTNYDEWSTDSGDTVVDWTWGSAATDGGAYAGLGEETAIAVQPSFNENATLWGQYYDGTVEQWELLSNDSDVTRTELDRTETLFVVAGSCDQFEDGESTDDGATGDESDEDRTDGDDEQTETTSEGEDEEQTEEDEETDTTDEEETDSERPDDTEDEEQTEEDDEVTDDEETDDDTDQEETEDDTDREETEEDDEETDEDTEGDETEEDEEETDDGPGASEGAPYGDDDDDGPGASEGAPHGNGNDGNSAGSSNGNPGNGNNGNGPGNGGGNPGNGNGNNGNGNGAGNPGNGVGNGGPPSLAN